MDAIVWKDNATVYSYMGAEVSYTFDLMVSRNPYNGFWVWHTAVKYRTSEQIDFYDFGQEETIAKAKAKSEDALGRWSAHTNGNDE